VSYLRPASVLKSPLAMDLFSNCSVRSGSKWETFDLQRLGGHQYDQTFSQFFGLDTLPEPEFAYNFVKGLVADTPPPGDVFVKQFLNLVDYIESNATEIHVDMLAYNVLTYMQYAPIGRFIKLHPRLELSVSKFQKTRADSDVGLMDDSVYMLAMFLQENKRRHWQEVTGSVSEENLHPLPQLFAQMIAAYQYNEDETSVKFPETLVSAFFFSLSLANC
jgi:hypothetical protein